MSVIALLVVLALIGLVAWALVRFVPMPAGVKTVIVVVAVVVCIVYALNAFGIIGHLPNPTVPKLK